MSSVPVITQWATPTTDYPAGSNPWNGTAVGSAPAYTYFTPGVPPAAQEMNYEFNLFTSAIQQTYDWVTSMALGNFPLAQVTSGAAGSGGSVPVFHRVYQRWIIPYTQKFSGSSPPQDFTLDLTGLGSGGAFQGGGYLSLDTVASTNGIKFGTTGTSTVTNTSDNVTFLSGDSDYTGGSDTVQATANIYFLASCTIGSTVSPVLMKSAANAADYQSATTFNTWSLLFSSTTPTALTLVGGLVKCFPPGTFVADNGTDPWPLVMGFTSTGVYWSLPNPGSVGNPIIFNQVGLPSGWSSFSDTKKCMFADTRPPTTTLTADGYALIALSGATHGTDVSRIMQLTCNGSGTYTATDLFGALTDLVIGLTYSSKDDLWAMARYTGTAVTIYTCPGAGLTSSSTWTLVATFSYNSTLGSTYLRTGNCLSNIGSTYILSLITNYQAGQSPRAIMCNNLLSGGSNATWRWSNLAMGYGGNGMGFTKGEGCVLATDGSTVSQSLQVGNYLGFPLSGFTMH